MPNLSPYPCLPLPLLILFLLTIPPTTSTSKPQPILPPLLTPTTTNLDIFFCGYNSPPLLNNHNGSIYSWDTELIKFDRHYELACFKQNQQVREQDRYVGLYQRNRAVGAEGTVLYRVGQGGIQEVGWWPFSGGEVIMDMKISAEIIAITVRNSGKWQIRIYNIQTLSLITTIPSPPYLTPTIDPKSNLLLFSSTPTNSFLTIYPSPTYTTPQQIHFTQAKKYLLYYYVDVGTYTPSQKISKFLFVFLVSEEDRAMGRVGEIGVEIFGDGENGGEVRVEVDPIVYREEMRVEMYCEDRRYWFDYQNNCVKEGDECIIDKAPTFGAQCILQHQSPIFPSLNRAKYLLISSQNTTKSIQLYESQKTLQIALIITICVAVPLILAFVVYWFCWRKKGQCWKGKDQGEGEGMGEVMIQEREGSYGRLEEKGMEAREK